MHKFNWLVLILLPALAACGNGLSGQKSLTLYDKKIDTAELKRRGATGYTTNEIRAMTVDKTVLFVGMNPHNQIEYYQPDGKAFLWYPGNKDVVQGQWYTEGNNRICFTYPSNTYNPNNPQQSGGQPACTSLVSWKGNVADSSDGDLFHLSTSHIPYVLEKFIFYKNLNEVVNKTGFDFRKTGK